MHFSIGFFTRLGVVLGSSWGRFGGQNAPQNFYRDLSWTVLSDLVLDCAVGWCQDGCPDRSKSASGGVLGRLGVVLGRFWELLGALGPSLGGLGGGLGPLLVVLGC